MPEDKSRKLNTKGKASHDLGSVLYHRSIFSVKFFFLIFTTPQPPAPFLTCYSFFIFLPGSAPSDPPDPVAVGDPWVSSLELFSLMNSLRYQKSTDTQVPFIKWHWTVSPLNLQISHPWTKGATVYFGEEENAPRKWEPKLNK